MPQSLEKKQKAFEIGGVSVEAGTNQTIDLPLGYLSNHAPMTLPVHVVHGRRAGPTFFVSAAVHGDEILGIEIIRRVLKSSTISKLRGTLLAVPIVNGPGFMTHSRYLPDRRDLNRCFPGSERGSMAARLADAFLNEVVLRCQSGVDLHTAALHRTNLPQIRYDNTSSDRLGALARAFGAPVVIESPLRDGSLRATAKSNGVEILLYEAGEALRFDEFAIRVGTRGVLNVMQMLDMLPAKTIKLPKRAPVISKSSFWVRAPEGGLLRAHKTTGDLVEKDEIIGALGDPFGAFEAEICAPEGGLIIGRTNLPIVNQGDALFHIARITKFVEAEDRLEAINTELDNSPLFDEDEII